MFRIQIINNFMNLRITEMLLESILWMGSKDKSREGF